MSMLIGSPFLMKEILMNSQLSSLNVKLKMVVMPSLPDTLMSLLTVSLLNFKNKNLSENIQWPKLLVISFSNKEPVVPSKLLEVKIFMKNIGLLLLLVISMKLQSSLLKCNPPMVEIPPLSECPTFPPLLVMFSLKKKPLVILKPIILPKLLVSGLWKSHTF